MGERGVLPGVDVRRLTDRADKNVGAVNPLQE